jgi:hypothetical protein
MGGIDWDEFASQIDGIIDSAASRTDERLASKKSSLTKLTDIEVQELFPEPSDIKKLAELMRIVKSAQSRNAKINALVSKADEFGGILITLLEKFV